LATTIDTLQPGELLNHAGGAATLPSPFAEFWQASEASHWGLKTH